MLAEVLVIKLVEALILGWTVMLMLKLEVVEGVELKVVYEVGFGNGNSVDKIFKYVRYGVNVGVGDSVGWGVDIIVGNGIDIADGIIFGFMTNLRLVLFITPLKVWMVENLWVNFYTNNLNKIVEPYLTYLRP